MRLLLAGGGTGGHLFPAVALAQQLLQQDESSVVRFVGTERGLEKRLLPKLGYELSTIDMVGVVGRGWKGRFEVVPKLTKSLVQSKKILAEFKPDIVIGVGGYASVPVLMMAKLLGIPYIIHEQNAIPGVSNRLLGKGAQRVCLSFAVSGHSFSPDKTIVTGNPVRPGLEPLASQYPVNGKLLIFGGSQGAKAINQAICGMLPILKEWHVVPDIIHQTGEDDFTMVQQAYRDAGFDESQVVPFIDDMTEAYAASCLVICRAGATTLAELAICGRPAILIPFPHATGDHQTANARTLKNRGAAVLLPQSELTAERLATLVRNLLADQQTLSHMAAQGQQLGQPGAARDILNECRKVLGQPLVEGH